MKKTLFSAGALVLGTVLVGYAQESVLATGNDASGSGGSVSYSVGQVGYETSGTDYTVAAGVQQPYEISQLSGIEEQALFNVKVYPNPTTDQVEVWMDNTALKATYQLYNNAGQLMETGDVINHVSLSMKDKPNAVYQLTITSEQSQQTFRIIKNQ